MPRAKKPDKVAEAEVEEAAQPPETAKQDQIEIPHSLSVRQLADILEVSAIDIIKQLMRNGIMANINQIVDFDTASAIATNLGHETRLKPRAAEGAASGSYFVSMRANGYRQTSRITLLR